MLILLVFCLSKDFDVGPFDADVPVPSPNLVQMVLFIRCYYCLSTTFKIGHFRSLNIDVR